MAAWLAQPSSGFEIKLETAPDLISQVWGEKNLRIAKVKQGRLFGAVLLSGIPVWPVKPRARMLRVSVRCLMSLPQLSGSSPSADEDFHFGWR